jgi:hypothetical protein
MKILGVKDLTSEKVYGDMSAFYRELINGYSLRQIQDVP